MHMIAISVGVLIILLLVEIDHACVYMYKVSDTEVDRLVRHQYCHLVGSKLFVIPRHVPELHDP
jgi:hypothetical protein